MMKEKYEAVELEVILFDSEDVIVTSGGGDTETPEVED